MVSVWSLAAEYIDGLWDKPMVDMRAMAPKVYAANPAFEALATLRRRLLDTIVRAAHRWRTCVPPSLVVLCRPVHGMLPTCRQMNRRPPPPLFAPKDPHFCHLHYHTAFMYECVVCGPAYPDKEAPPPSP